MATRYRTGVDGMSQEESKRTIRTALERALSDFILDGDEGPTLPPGSEVACAIDALIAALVGAGYATSDDWSIAGVMDNERVRALVSVEPGISMLRVTREAGRLLPDALVAECFFCEKWSVHDSNMLRRLMVAYVLASGIKPPETDSTTSG